MVLGGLCFSVVGIFLSALIFSFVFMVLDFKKLTLLAMAVLVISAGVLAFAGDPQPLKEITVVDTLMDIHNDDIMGRLPVQVAADRYYVQDKWGDIYMTPSLTVFNQINKAGNHTIILSQSNPYQITGVIL